MTITIEQVWTSSTGLIKRFNLNLQFYTAWVKYLEEEGELIEALYEFAPRRGELHYRGNVVKETSDCLVTLMNVIYSAGLGFENDDMPKLPRLIMLWEKASESGPRIRDVYLKLQTVSYAFHAEINDHLNTRTLPAHVIEDTFIRLITALLSCCKSQGLTFEEFEGALESILYKNNAKSHKTHVVENGFIKKIAPIAFMESGE